MDGDIGTLTYFRGRVALAAVLEALGVGPGDAVLTQAFTCVAVPEAIMAVGARPVYVDIEPGGVNMSVPDLAAKIGPRAKALIVQHTYGIMADMGPLMDLAAEHDLPVIEDCCHTFDSSLNGKMAGRFGRAAFYSYEWGKPVIVGIGGSLRVNDPELARKLTASYGRYREPSPVKQARLFAQYMGFGVLYRPSLYWYVKDAFHALGRLGLAESNYNPVGPGQALSSDFSTRMSRIHRMMLKAKVRGSLAFAAHSRQLTEMYRRGLGDLGVRFPAEPKNADNVLLRLPLLVDDKEALLEAARRARVELSGWYATPIHPLEGPDLAKVAYETGSCPEAEKRTGEIVTLPLGPKVKQRDVRRALEFLHEQG